MSLSPLRDTFSANLALSCEPRGRRASPLCFSTRSLVVPGHPLLTSIHPSPADLAVAKRDGTLAGNKAAAVARRNAVKDALARRREKRAVRMTFAQQLAAAKAAAAAKAEAAAQAAAAQAAPVASSASGSGAVDQTRVLTGPVALAAQGRRCGADITCRATTTPPANAAAICLVGRCAFQCNDGFAPTADGNGCFAVTPICNNGAVCPQPANGYSSCDVGGQCVPGCDAGYTGVTNSGGAFVCLNFNTDASNCGAVGVVCPASCMSLFYPRLLPSLWLTSWLPSSLPQDNGIGTTSCQYGTCTINCPFGSIRRRADSTSNPFYW